MKNYLVRLALHTFQTVETDSEEKAIEMAKANIDGALEPVCYAYMFTDEDVCTTVVEVDKEWGQDIESK